MGDHHGSNDGSGGDGRHDDGATGRGGRDAPASGLHGWSRGTWIAIGAGLGVVLLAVTDDPVWIAIGAGIGVAVGAGGRGADDADGSGSG
jgi:hypothetical protein